MIRFRPAYIFILLAILCWSSATAQFTLVGKKRAATICVASSEPAYVQLAVQDLVNDVEKITGQRLKVVSTFTGSETDLVLVGTINNTDLLNAAAQYNMQLPQDLLGKWEAYQASTHSIKQRQFTALLITGSNARGTMFGVYHFIQHYVGVDPLHFWKDREPTKKKTLQWNAVDIRANVPTFTFRGWFINDEDLLTEWMESGGVRKIDYPFYGQVVNAKAIEHVMEAAARLRMNLVIPASFIDIDNPAEARIVDEAARRGLFVSMHHVEPMGVSAFTFFNYWEKRGKKPRFSFYSSRSELIQVWKEYAAKWARYPNVIWQIGLRGIADRPMWMADPATPQSDAERGALITEAMRLQLNIIREATRDSTPVVTTTLWGEGSAFFRQGHLQIPEGVMAIFSDNSPGWRWQNDFWETPREAGRRYGIYYHHQLWSSGPHLVQAVPPAKTHALLKQAVEKGSAAYAILNVSNIREFVLGLQASSELLSSISTFEPEAFLKRWAKDNFGTNGDKALAAYRAYFAAFQTPGSHPVPFLLDGHLRSKGLEALNKLLQQATQPKATAASQEAAVSQEGKWVSGHLGDMNPAYSGIAELRTKLAAQQAGFDNAKKLAQAAQAGMTVSERDFLDVNLMSHLQLMKALGSWLSHLLDAQLALEQDQRKETVIHLEKALSAFTGVKKALAMNSKGKWKHWYRGEKKMNLSAMEAQTARVLTAFRNAEKN